MNENEKATLAVKLFSIRKRLDAVQDLTVNTAVRKEVGILCDELTDVAVGISTGLDGFCKACHQNLVDESQTKCSECLADEESN